MNNFSSPNSLLQLVAQVCTTLKEREVRFALAGGLVADLYRGEPRATDDVDVLVSIDEDNVEIGKEILETIGFSPGIETKEMLKGNTRFRRKAKRSAPQIIVGRNPNGAYGVDLLLLSFPWAPSALRRSQKNFIQIVGIGKVPCLTVEDLVISKLFAIKNNSSRRYRKSDIADITLIMENNLDIDLNYLSNEMENLQLVFPKVIEKAVPPVISRLSRRLRKKSPEFDY